MKKLSKSQRIWGSVLVVFAAIMTLLAIIFGVKWKQTKDTLSKFDSVISLNFDVNNDGVDDYSLTFKDQLGGTNLSTVLTEKIPANEKYKFEIDFSGMLDTVYFPDGRSFKNNKDKNLWWGIYTSTNDKVWVDPKNPNAKEKMTSVGVNDLIMGPVNEFTFTFPGTLN